MQVDKFLDFFFEKAKVCFPQKKILRTSMEKILERWDAECHARLVPRNFALLRTKIAYDSEFYYWD